MPPLKLVPSPLAPPLLFLLLLLVPFLFSSPALAQASTLPALSSYANKEALDDAFSFYWTFGTSPPRLDMAIQAKTNGWVALGFSEVGAMVGTGEELDSTVLHGTELYIAWCVPPS